MDPNALCLLMPKLKKYFQSSIVSKSIFPNLIIETPVDQGTGIDRQYIPLNNWNNNTS
jgi:hypothetical protein